VTKPPATPFDPVLIHRLCRHYRLGSITSIEFAGGTASPKAKVTTTDNRYMLRQRPSYRCDANLIRFDHAYREFLHRRDLPAPYLIATRDGRTSIQLGERYFELAAWVDGSSFDWADLQQLASLGEMLGRLHRLSADFTMPCDYYPLREDDPVLMMPVAQQLKQQCRTNAQHAAFEDILQRLAELHQHRLAEQYYRTLPSAIIHGDVHPGNVGFHAHSVSALYDWDWASPQARVSDLTDALCFFAFRRDDALNSDDIRSLTQPWHCDLDRSGRVLQSYHAVIPVGPAEIDAIVPLLTSRWISCRLCGARKVLLEQQIEFVLTGLFEPLGWLDRYGEDFVAHLKNFLR